MGKRSILVQTAFEKATTWRDSLFTFLWGWAGFQLLGFLLSLIFQNINILETQRNAAVNFIVYALLFVGMIAYFLIRNRQGLRVIGKGFLHLNSILLGLVIFFAFNLLSTLYSTIAQAAWPWIKDNANENNVNNLITLFPVSSFFMVVIFAPFCEELTYRGGLATLIARKNRLAGYLVAAVVFAFIHFDFIGSIEAAIKNDWAHVYIELINLPLYILAGLGLGGAYQMTGNLSASMTSHLLNNLMSFIFTFI